MVLLGAFDGDTLWGAARIDHPMHDNLHSATAEIYTHPDRSRRGIGRALAEASYDVARTRGRRVLTAEAYAPVGETSAGVLFGAAMGFEEALVDGMKVVDLRGDRAAVGRPGGAGGAAARGLHGGDLAGPRPRRAGRGLLPAQRDVHQEAPMGELEVEPERWDESRVREREERNLRQGRRDMRRRARSPRTARWSG